jgi:hypothetical protein
MGINQLITKQKICDALRGIQLNLNSIIFVGNEKICSPKIFEKRLRHGKFISQSQFLNKTKSKSYVLTDSRFVAINCVFVLRWSIDRDRSSR